MIELISVLHEAVVHLRRHPAAVDELLDLGFPEVECLSLLPNLGGGLRRGFTLTTRDGEPRLRWVNRLLQCATCDGGRPTTIPYRRRG